jgi:hypothetical protein
MHKQRTVIFAIFCLRPHGEYHIPDTHGKLYDIWRWAGSPGDRAQALLGRISPALTKAVDFKDTKYLRRKKLPAWVEVFESTFDLLKAMTPPIRSYTMTKSYPTIKRHQTHS